MSQKVMFVAGEASGDHHAAALIRELKRSRPDLEIFGFGGREMAAAGMRLDLDLAQKSVIGLVEVLRHLGFFRRAFKEALALLREQRPDLLVLVDYPGFNLRLAEKAKALGIKICYYISPQVWAWKAGRVPKMARILDKMLVTFPFEKEIYDKAGLACVFVGNPLLDLVKPEGQPLPEAPGQRWVGLLPGSRVQEVASLLPVMLDAAQLLRRQIEDLRFVVIKAPQLSWDLFKRAQEMPGCLVLEGKSASEAYAARAACSFAMVASGTATLETAMLKVPFIILYRINPLSFAIGKRLVKIHSIGLANVVAGRRVVPEFLQDLDPKAIAAEASGFLKDPAKAKAQLADLEKGLASLGSPGVAGRAAGELLGML